MKKRTVCVVVGLLAFVPALVSAVSVDELTAQVQSLVAQLTAMRNQANSLGGVTVISGNSVLSNNTAQGSCPSLYRNIARGARGPDVQSLQRYLMSLGMLAPDSDSGFYGVLTEGAVQKWQTARGIVSAGSPATTGWGAVGSRTRAAIATQCYAGATPSKAVSCPLAPPPATACTTKWQANTDTNGCTTSYSCSVALPGAPLTSTAFTAAPLFGAFPLVVSFITKISNPTSYVGGSYQIDYGDSMAEMVAGCSLSGVRSLDSGLHIHTYSTPGTYSARLLFVNRGACSPGTVVCAEKQELVGSLTVTVGATLSSMSIPATTVVTPQTVFANPSTLFTTPSKTVSIPVSTFTIPATQSTPSTTVSIPSTTITIPATVSTTPIAPNLTFTIPGTTIVIPASSTTPSRTYTIPSATLTITQSATTTPVVKLTIPSSTFTTEASSSTPATLYTVPETVITLNPVIN